MTEGSGLYLAGPALVKSAIGQEVTSEELGGAPAITMELLSGGTLKDRVSAEGPMPPSAAVSAVLDIIGGLDAAQAAGILHRDIKPSNCFVDADGDSRLESAFLVGTKWAQDRVIVPIEPVAYREVRDIPLPDSWAWITFEKGALLQGPGHPGL